MIASCKDVEESDISVCSVYKRKQPVDLSAVLVNVTVEVMLYSTGVCFWYLFYRTVGFF
jgi:hypothetical protein